jgi:hypothetical protein
MKKEERIRWIIIIISAAVALLGAFLIMTRGNPLDEAIGDVVVTNGRQRVVINGVKYSYNDEDSSKKSDIYVPIEKAEGIPALDYDMNDENCNISVSYSDEYTGDIIYTVYDTDFNEILTDQKNLTIPAECGKEYYISAKVNWGDEDKNVTVMYYFKINVLENQN